MKYIYILIFIFIGFFNQVFGQLKFVIEDFEGFADNQTEIKKDGLFTFGSAKAIVQKNLTISKGYSGNRAIKISWLGKEKFGGWGKGLGRLIDLEPEKDFLNFYIYSPATNNKTKLKISIEEDDNENGKFEDVFDDVWILETELLSKNEWQLISLPLNKFKNSNKGGDGIFNTGYTGGKIFSIFFTFSDSIEIKQGQVWHFDFLSFSQNSLKTKDKLFLPPSPSSEDFSLLGAWSEEGNFGNFDKIGETFEGYFKNEEEKKLSVVHFFQPFASGKDIKSVHFPSVDHINQIIDQGYVPMITLENHFVKVGKNEKQPNLYSIVEGHFDYLFYEWTERIKQANGVVLLRILHEFNGDWYPWCISKNDNQTWLYIEAYKRIANFFKHHNVENVKFVWCPNSMSIPQEKWNYIMDAYPGDDYVDYVGLDVYNGAGEAGIPIWRSFRKEAIENYYLLTTKLPHKPLLICETSSRERKSQETGVLQDKAGWIEQMGEAITSDLSKIRLVVWFNEYENFKVTSSPAAKKAFGKSIWKNDFFRSGKEESINKGLKLIRYR